MLKMGESIWIVTEVIRMGSLHQLAKKKKKSEVLHNEHNGDLKSKSGVFVKKEGWEIQLIHTEKLRIKENVSLISVFIVTKGTELGKCHVLVLLIFNICGKGQHSHLWILEAGDLMEGLTKCSYKRRQTK